MSKTITVKTSTGRYDILLESGGILKAKNHFNLCRKCHIITDSGVPLEYAKSVKVQCESAVITVVPEGEKSKNLDTFRDLLSKMVANNFTRNDCVIAVGGGMVGDLAGFVAASYMRGVDFYNIPTTVLSQVDSSIGGKVAVDFEDCKNLVGAFYPPKGVIIDCEVLKTLPARQVSNGLAEALKMAMTSDKELFRVFENESISDNMNTIIERSLLIKKSVVEADEKETGLRKVLNFGHTLAHAIESENGMQNLYHGECVALGMLPMCSDLVRERLIPVLRKLNLPVEVKWNHEKIASAMRHDKKMSGDEITAIYVQTIGNFEFRTIPFSEMLDTIERAGIS